MLKLNKMHIYSQRVHSPSEVQNGNVIIKSTFQWRNRKNKLDTNIVYKLKIKSPSKLVSLSQMVFFFFGWLINFIDYAVWSCMECSRSFTESGPHHRKPSWSTSMFWGPRECSWLWSSLRENKLERSMSKSPWERSQISQTTSAFTSKT